MANSRLCSISDCGKPRHGNGYCSAHYTRLRRHGDPLGGGSIKAPKGDPLRFIHEVALKYAGDECLSWPYGKDQHGYGQLKIDGKHVGVSRYLCELVHGAPPTPDHESAHSCGRGHEGCISRGHLLWKTPAENQADRLVHGTHSRGERQGRSKLTEATVREIISMKGNEPQHKLAKRFGVSISTVSHIYTSRRWAWLLEDVRRNAE